MGGSKPYFYTVKPGDTLSRIGARFSVRWLDIAAANGLVRPWLIYPGQELEIPGRTARPPKRSPGKSGAPFVFVEGDQDNTVHAWWSRWRVRFLVIHDPVARTPAGLLRYLKQNDRTVSYNEVLVPASPPKAHVLVGSASHRVGHAGFGRATDSRDGKRYGRTKSGHTLITNLNNVSWGICIFKHRDDYGPFPADLYEAAVHLAAERAEQFGVPTANILAHRETDPGRRSDPRGIDMDQFRRDVDAVRSVSPF